MPTSAAGMGGSQNGRRDPAPPESRTRVRVGLARRSAFLAFQIVATLFLSEVAVRLLTPRVETLRQLNYNPRWTGATSRARTLQDLMAGSHRGFRPFDDVGGFRTNSHGLRAPEYSPEKGSRCRILTLGDSFTFAGKTPYRMHWPKRFEIRLREELDVPAEVINLGYPSVGPKFELRMWQIEGHRLNADLVIQAFYVGNDFLDGLRLRIAPFSIAQALVDYSALYRIARNLYRHRTMVSDTAARDTAARDTAARDTATRDTATRDTATRDTAPRRRRRVPRHNAGGFEIEGYEPRHADRPTFRPKRFHGLVARTMQVARISNRARFEAAFKKGGQILLETRRAVESTGARYLLMIIPSEFQVDPEVARGGTALKGTTIDEYEIDWAQKRFAVFCEENDIDCLDLLPAFRERGRSAKLYWLRDSHWNIEGNLLAAEELLEHGRGSDLLSGKGPCAAGTF